MRSAKSGHLPGVLEKIDQKKHAFVILFLIISFILFFFYILL